MTDYEPIASPSELEGAAALRAAALAKLGWDAPEAAVQELFRTESLVRFLRASNASVIAGADMLVASVQWRQSYELEKTVEAFRKDTSPAAEELRQLWPCGVHGKDRRGCPVYYARYGRVDLAALSNDAGFDRFLACALSDQRTIESALDETAKTSGRHPVQVVCVADLDGMQWTRAVRAVPTFKKLSKVLDENFPERLHVAFVARAPWIFAAVYNLVTPFLAADTKMKVVICGKRDDHLAALSKLVEPDQIPEFLGGTSKCAIPDGSKPDADPDPEISATPLTVEVRSGS